MKERYQVTGEGGLPVGGKRTRDLTGWSGATESNPSEKKGRELADGVERGTASKGNH